MRREQERKNREGGGLKALGHAAPGVEAEGETARERGGTTSFHTEQNACMRTLLSRPWPSFSAAQWLSGGGAKETVAGSTPPAKRCFSKKEARRARPFFLPRQTPTKPQ